MPTFANSPYSVHMSIGRAVKRKEDLRFITGKGHYLDDFNRQHQLHAAFVRSPHAHAEIRKINKAKALKVPGVVAVLTGDHWMALIVVAGGSIAAQTDEPDVQPPLAHDDRLSGRYDEEVEQRAPSGGGDRDDRANQ